MSFNFCDSLECGQALLKITYNAGRQRVECMLTCKQGLLHLADLFSRAIRQIPLPHKWQHPTGDTAYRRGAHAQTGAVTGQTTLVAPVSLLSHPPPSSCPHFPPLAFVSALLPLIPSSCPSAPPQLLPLTCTLPNLCCHGSSHTTGSEHPFLLHPSVPLVAMCKLEPQTLHMSISDRVADCILNFAADHRPG